MTEPMKFYQLRKGQAFRFVCENGELTQARVSAGVDGAYGRYVPEGADWWDSESWWYCRPLDEVVPE